MNYNNKTLLLVLIMSLLMSSLTGCYVTPSGEIVLLSSNGISDNKYLLNTVSDDMSDDKIISEETVTANEVSEDEIVEHDADNSLKETEAEYSIEDIAGLNNMEVSELNVCFDDENYLTFLGNKYCEDVIENEEDALNSLGHIHSLIGLNDSEMKFYKLEESMVSGYKYYIFYKQSEVEYDGQSMPSIDYNNMVKVIVDKDGLTAGVSASINHTGNSILSAYTATEDDEDYFANMAEAGDFTYSISADWIKTAYSEYEGDTDLEVTIPIMYDKINRTYCIGDIKRRIAVTNAYDFELEDSVINLVVTDNPNDISSWHFASASDESNYFCNPEYIIASYDAFVRAYDLFEERYDISSSGEKSYMLGVYACSDTYPANEKGFITKMAAYENINGFGYIASSPMYAECLNEKFIVKELTAGIISDMISTKGLLNQHGALIEAYTDIIGVRLTDLYNEDSIDAWKLGGVYSSLTRDLGAPLYSLQPEIIGGLYYVDEVDECFTETTGNGGRYVNCSIPEYLAYNMVNGALGKSDSLETLTDDELVDVWFESMYMLNNTSDFYDLQYYLKQSMEICNIDSNKQEYVEELEAAYGFMKETPELLELTEEEDYRLVSINYIDEDNEFFKDYAITYDIITDDGRIASTGVIKDTIPEIKYALNNSIVLSMSIYDMSSNSIVSQINTSTLVNSVDTEGFSITIKNLLLNEGDKFVIPDEEVITELDDNSINIQKALLLDGSAKLDDAGEYFIMTKEIEAEDGNYNLYHVHVE